MTVSRAQSLLSIQAMTGMSHLRSHMGRSMRISMSWRSLPPTWLHNRFDAQSEPQEPFPVFPASRNQVLTCTLIPSYTHTLLHSYPLTLIHSYAIYYSHTPLLIYSNTPPLLPILSIFSYIHRSI